MKILSIIIIIISIFIIINSSIVQAETLTGIVINQYNNPIPGLTVSLVHPYVGRSSPSITDSWGRYFFSNVPLINTPYYIEIYWGYQLIYRSIVVIVGNVQWQPIILAQ